jgi:hypothetical protein
LASLDGGPPRLFPASISTSEYGREVLALHVKGMVCHGGTVKVVVGTARYGGTVRVGSRGGRGGCAPYSQEKRMVEAGRIPYGGGKSARDGRGHWVTNFLDIITIIL